MSESRDDFFVHYGFPPEAFDPSTIPAIAEEFPDPEGIEAFANALHAPDVHPVDELTSPSSASLPPRSPRPSEAGDASGELLSPDGRSLASPDFRQTLSLTQQQPPLFISAQNDWAPVNEKVRRPSRGGGGEKTTPAPRPLLGERTKDETREGYLYTLLKWPLFLGVLGVLAVEWTSYLLTRLYIYLYEQLYAWRGTRARLRRNMRTTDNYADWVVAAKELDGFLGRGRWKQEDEYAYYDAKTVKRVWDHMKRLRRRAEKLEVEGRPPEGRSRLAEELRVLAETCIKSNFVGVESPRLYSQTYYGTKNLVQRYVDEGMSTSLRQTRLWRR